MSKPKQTITERILARAIRTQPLTMCSDGVRRDSWKAVLLIAKQQPFYLRRVFRTEHDALVYAEREREKHIALGRMPETMVQRQKRQSLEADQENED